MKHRSGVQGYAGTTRAGEGSALGSPEDKDGFWKRCVAGGFARGIPRQLLN